MRGKRRYLSGCTNTETLRTPVLLVSLDFRLVPVHALADLVTPVQCSVRQLPAKRANHQLILDPYPTSRSNKASPKAAFCRSLVESPTFEQLVHKVPGHSVLHKLAEVTASSP